MGERQFTLVARIRTTDHAALGAALANLIPQGVITLTLEGFRVEAELEGASARDLNRMLLSRSGGSITGRPCMQHGQTRGLLSTFSIIRRGEGARPRHRRRTAK